MPGGGGVSAIQQIRARHPEVAVLVLTMHEDDEALFSAIRQGHQTALPDCKGVGPDQRGRGHRHRRHRQRRGYLRAVASPESAMVGDVLSWPANSPGLTSCHEGGVSAAGVAAGRMPWVSPLSVDRLRVARLCGRG
ncbi:hypothetical protein [Actinoplanes sp. CA-252034]|uniref:hypothetical protein n=1 Tax=Actinoplanes sp. CA-252034 TaxID=3239906 RepID=UPI003D97C1AB